MFFISIILSIYIFNFSQASTDMTLEGVITQFDEKTMTLKQKNSAMVKIPRSVYPAQKGIITGKTHVKVKVRASEFLELNKQHFSQSKSDSKK